MQLLNVFFPIWFIYVWPPIVFITLVVNLIVDGAVFFGMMKYYNKEVYWYGHLKYLWGVFGIGYLADLLGIGFLIVITHMFDLSLYLNYAKPGVVIVHIIAVLFSGILIYIFNKLFLSRVLDPFLAKRIALALAILTAPYTFLIAT